MNTFSPYKRFFGSFLPNCMLRSIELSFAEKVVWSRLSQYAGEREFCYPKQKTLAFELGTTERTIIRALSRLEELGFVKVERPESVVKMKRLGNKYYLLEHEIFNESSHDNLSCESDDMETLQTKTPANNLSHDNLSRVESKRIKQENQETKTSKNFIELFPRTFQQDKNFTSTWEEFLQFRKEDKKAPVSKIAAQRFVSTLKIHPISTAIKMIDRSIENGYRGIFEINQNNTSSRQQVKYGHVAKEQVYGKADIVLNNEDF